MIWLCCRWLYNLSSICLFSRDHRWKAWQTAAQGSKWVGVNAQRTVPPEQGNALTTIQPIDNDKRVKAMHQHMMQMINESKHAHLHVHLSVSNWALRSHSSVPGNPCHLELSLFAISLYQIPKLFFSFFWKMPQHTITIQLPLKKESLAACKAHCNRVCIVKMSCTSLNKCHWDSKTVSVFLTMRLWCVRMYTCRRPQNDLSQDKSVCWSMPQIEGPPWEF